MKDVLKKFAATDTTQKWNNIINREVFIMKNNNTNASKTNNRGKVKGRIKGLVAVALSVVLFGGTIAGC